MKKLVSVSICNHDSSLTYFDDQKTYYFKTERIEEIKHAGYESISDFKLLLQELIGVNEDWDSVIGDYIVIDYTKEELLDHHYAHFLSGKILKNDVNNGIVIDGYSDSDLTSAKIIKNGKIVESLSLKEHGSIGIVMIDLGYYCGIDGNIPIDIPGKLMGFQSFGSIDQTLLSKLEYFVPNVYNVNSIYEIINELKPYKWTVNKNVPDNAVDIAATVHHHFENILVKFFEMHFGSDKNQPLIYSGGVAQNVIWNTRLRNIFPNLIIPPHCGDEGLSIGGMVHLFQKHDIKLNEVQFLNNYPFESISYIEDDKESYRLNEKDFVDTVANKLANGKIVGLYSGEKSEIGPRALGNRSILMDPCIKNGKDKINVIKRREFYRPFGGIILKEFFDDYFEGNSDNPYMLYVAKVKENVNIDAIRHVDNTCRIQTVDKNDPAFYLIRQILEKFYDLTGCPVLLNTSLNLAGKPIASYIRTAKQFFHESELDVLAIINNQKGYCLIKEEQ